MEKKSAIYLVIAAIIIVLLIIGVKLSRNSAPIQSPEQTISTSSQDQAPTSSANSTLTPRNVPLKQPLSYSAALKIYLNKRVQFDSTCQMIPAILSIKNNTQIMFDNRSGKNLQISLDNKKYDIEKNGFLILFLSNKTLPHTIAVDCGSGKNNGRIILN